MDWLVVFLIVVNPMTFCGFMYGIYHLGIWMHKRKMDRKYGKEPQ